MAFQIRPVEQTVENQGVKAVVYGGSGIGKTRLTLTCPRPLYLSAEVGGLSLRGSAVPTVLITGLPDLIEVYNWAKQSREAAAYDTLVLDSMSEMAENILRVAKQNTKDGRKAHNDAYEVTVVNVFNAFRDLPRKHVYMICKERHDEDTLTHVKQYKPSMPNGNLIRETPYKFDYVFRLFQHIDAQQQRSTWLQCAADATAVAKDRSGRLAMYEPPDLGVIFTKAMQ